MGKGLKQRIFEEMLISDEFTYDLTKQLYLSGRLNLEFEEMTFDELYNEVNKRLDKMEKSKKP